MKRIVIAVDLVVWVVMSTRMSSPETILAALAMSSLATLAIIGLGSMYRIASLRGGGEIIALQMGGTPVPAQTRDPQLRRLRRRARVLT